MRLYDNTRISLVAIIVLLAFAIFYSQTPQTPDPQNKDENVNNTVLENLGNYSYLVDSWTLKYYHTDWEEPRPCNDYGPFSVIFESPQDNLVMHFEGVQRIPDDEFFFFPLVVYQGDAYSVDSNPYWINNVSCVEPVQVELGEAGWYTVCLTGDVVKNGHRFSLRGWGNSTHDTVLIYASFSLEENDVLLSFKVDNRVWE